MRKGYSAVLADRGVVRIGGAEARGFLQNIVTTDMDRVAVDRAGFGALLSPQGKILADFLVFADDGGFLIDLPKAALADFVKRMTLYRLRAKVEIADLSTERKVAVFWRGDAPDGAVPDPRLAELGHRAILPGDASLENETSADAWHAHRIALGVPEGGRDFAFGEAFPHDVDMDDLDGLDFRKGCYVGQEIVSRMQHRGTARRRAVIVTGEGALPDAGTSVEGNGKALGAMGSHAGATGIALLRLDRTRLALDSGATISAGGVPLSVTLPAFARFGWPAGSEDEGAA
ncbi:folate-binding protein [Kaistia geumhonensis]|uniref:Folate-binding protein YgfZ n=1 Tax=Kaistia geumhonensis TaxID=410839 RepID=A0ABU0M3J1_9HYPH|nr:folate-binding protein [Kaistia geumhonensis]MCX5479273.1 folate-binding protein [Kaistia geumhonensis]MDQ0515506.1 folate-binding protein YgfZ [Kaistia geumhonensis]